MWVPKTILPAGMRMIAPAMERMVETWFIYGHAAELCIGTGDLRLRHQRRLLKPLHTPPAKKCIIATQSTSTWPMDCWLVGCGGDEGFQLAHERSALRYMSLHYTPLHHVWLMTLCDFLLDLHATYIRIPACKKHSTISNTLLLLLFANAMGFHCMNLIWFDAMTASTHAKQSVVVEAFILQVSCSAPLESWSFFNSGQDSSPTVSWSNVVVSEGTHEFAHRPVWKEENAAPDLQKSWFALKVLKS